MATTTVQAPTAAQTVTIQAPRLVTYTGTKTWFGFEGTGVQAFFLALCALAFATILVSMGMDVAFNDELALSTTPFIFQNIMKVSLGVLVGSIGVLAYTHLAERNAKN